MSVVEPADDLDLEWRFDDPADPAELTVYDPDGERTTAWLTVDADDAVALEEIR